MRNIDSPKKLLIVAGFALAAACASPSDDADPGAAESGAADDGSEAPLALQALRASVSYNGSGCRVGDTSYSVTSDGLTYTFLVPNMVASASSGATATSDCTILITPPDATKYGVNSVKYTGAANIPVDSVGKVSFRTSVQGAGAFNSTASNVPVPTISSRYNAEMYVAPSMILYPPGQRGLSTSVMLLAHGANGKAASLGDVSSTITIRLSKR